MHLVLAHAAHAWLEAGLFAVPALLVGRAIARSRAGRGTTETKETP